MQEPARAAKVATRPLVQMSLVDLAVSELRRCVFAGHYEPGERLVEERLTEQLGISRPPLREALRVLVEQGLLEQVPRKGVRVTLLSPRDMTEIYSLRGALERLAVELTFSDPSQSRPPPARLDALEEALDEMWAAAELGDAVGVLEANCRFHKSLVDLADHDRLSRTYHSLMQQMQLAMSVNLRSEAGAAGDLLEGCRRHKRLLVSLRTGTREVVLAELAHHGSLTYLDVASPLRPVAAVATTSVAAS